MVTEFIEFTNDQGTRMRYYYPDFGKSGKPAKWICVQQNNEWIPLRKATNEDIRQINQAIVESYHK